MYVNTGNVHASACLHLSIKHIMQAASVNLHSMRLFHVDEHDKVQLLSHTQSIAKTYR